MKVKVLALNLLVAVSVALPAFARGVDTKVYPGLMGVRWAKTDPVPRLGVGALFNPSSNKALRVDLPVLRDASSIRNGSVRVLDENPLRGQNVRIQLNSRYRGCRFLGWSSPAQFSNGRSICEQSLNFRSVGRNSKSHYFISCSIPRAWRGRQSAVVSYTVVENN